MKFKAIIVDDVELAREQIRQLLRDDEIEIIAECENGREAIKAIRELKPDLVFLDIQMPEIGGFEVLEAIGAGSMPGIIFVTAYDEFALKAFEVNAIDYLLKPFDGERLEKAVAKAKKEIMDSSDYRGIEAKLRSLLTGIRADKEYLRKIPIRSARGITFVRVDDIDWIGSAGHYLELHTGRETHLLREKISSIEAKLDPNVFVRIHRSTIVNIDRIRSVHPLFNGDQLVILQDGSELNLSRTYYDKVMARFAI